nr:PLP-dependent aminotransferase family protein [Pelagicoccus albus]
MRGSPDSLNTYGHGEGGYLGLREAIAGHLRTHRGVRCSADQILIFNGSQPGLDLVARALVESGDRVAVEDPCFKGVADAFRMSGAEVLPVPVDLEGMKVEELLAQKRSVRLVVATPARQFPIGSAMPVGRQAVLLEWARKKGAWILEDDYDSEFRFRGKPLPAMQGLAGYDRILYLGTFTRSMFPDVRIGYLVVPKHAYPDFLTLWKVGAMNPSISIQATLAEFIRQGHYLRHVRKMRQLYAKRSHWLADKVLEMLGDWIELGPTDGGMHFVGFFKKPVDIRSLAKSGSEQGYAFRALSSYAIETKGRDGLMFGFSSFSESKMLDALTVLRGILSASV